MSVRTTADDRLDKASDCMGDAIKALGDIVIEKCWGHDEYRQEYEDTIRSVYIQLVELRAKLNR